MRYRIAIVRNIERLQEAYESLEGRDQGTPGMGLIYGYTGLGKSTAVAWLLNQVRGLQVRALACWTPSGMLGALMRELGAAPLNRSAAMVDHIVAELRRSGRPVFVDESDYLLRDTRMLETLRDIHDSSGAPVVLIGMEGIERKLVHRPQLAGRISQWVEFAPTDLADARVLADTVCEVGIADDLLEQLLAGQGVHPTDGGWPEPHRGVGQGATSGAGGPGAVGIATLLPAPAGDPGMSPGKARRLQQQHSRQQAWNSIRFLQRFTWRDLVATGTIRPERAQAYCRLLAGQGYLRLARPRKSGEITLWQLVQDTGPLAPEVKHWRRQQYFVDFNTQKVVALGETEPEVRHAEEEQERAGRDADPAVEGRDGGGHRRARAAAAGAGAHRDRHE